MKKHSLLIAVVLLAQFSILRAEDGPHFDLAQKKIVQAVTDDFVARIAQLKPDHSPLAKFGEAPVFTRLPDGFRYDFQVEKVFVKTGESLQERPRRGGCFIVFRLLPENPTTDTNAAPDLADYFSGASWGGPRAGICYDFRFALYQKPDGLSGTFVDPHDAALADDLKRTFNDEANGLFARLTSERILTQKGIRLDIPSLLAAAENPDGARGGDFAKSISYNALVTLRFHPMNSAQWAAFRKRLGEGRYHATAFSVGEIDRLAQQHAPGERPQVLLDLVKTSLRAEQSGDDTFQRTPFAGQTWASDAQAVRTYVVAHLQDNVESEIPIAALVLTADTVARTRKQSLDYLVRQPGAAARQLVLDGLTNSDRSVQAYAAQLAGAHRLVQALPALRALLQSPSVSVREAAASALKQLGAPVAIPSAPALSDAARVFARTLWQRGLNKDDIVKSQNLMMINARLLPSLDRASVESAIDHEINPGRNLTTDPLFMREPIPSPFLLAAAVRLQDDAAAVRAYGTMCEDYENDEEALADATNELGWDRFAKGLDEFHHHRDGVALSYLAQVAALAPFSRPFSLLSIYLDQSAELVHYLRTRAPDSAAAVPGRANIAASVKYWLTRLKDDDGEQPDPAAEIIRQLGLPAVPYLLDAVVDRTPTRTFSYYRSYLPERDFIYVGNDAIFILEEIAGDYGATFPISLLNERAATPAFQEKLRVFFAALPPDPPLLPPAKRPPPIIYPSGRYFWGDN